MKIVCWLVTSIFMVTAELTQYNGQCDASVKTCTEHDNNWAGEKFIFYDVNPPEGFNLRRDVYMRFAIMLAEARKHGIHSNWSLVLPPWYAMYHWRKPSSRKKPSPWNHFFDLESLKSYAPVLELHEIFSKSPSKPLQIDTLYILQNFENAFEDGDFRNKWEVAGPCSYHGDFWGYSNITAKNVLCLKFQGSISQLWEVIALHKDEKVMFHHGEIPLHDNYGTKSYWECRKSMKFNDYLIAKAKEYISKQLHCNTDQCANYLSIHWRRQDFARYRPKDVPSVAGTAKQIDDIIKNNSLEIKDIFIATDATISEKDALKIELNKLSYKAHFYLPSDDLDEGRIAIIDQIICSHAAFFMGTHESTFTFRIQEEREILGFDSSTTFNRLCPDVGKCEGPSKWTIVH